MNGRIYRALASFMVLALMLAALPVPSAGAATPTDLFFSEYIEGSSNNKALEIYNGTGAAVNLGTGGYNVQMFFNGNSTAGLTINLTGTVANGDVYVLAQSSAAAAILAQADQTNGSGWFNGDDAVVLRKNSVIIDVIGQIDENTRLVALASCHFISGYRIDIAAIGRYLQERKVLFCLDAIQTAGAFPLPIEYVDMLAAVARAALPAVELLSSRQWEPRPAGPGRGAGSGP